MYHVLFPLSFETCKERGSFISFNSLPILRHVKCVYVYHLISSLLRYNFEMKMLTKLVTCILSLDEENAFFFYLNWVNYYINTIFF